MDPGEALATVTARPTIPEDPWSLVIGGRGKLGPIGGEGWCLGSSAEGEKDSRKVIPFVFPQSQRVVSHLPSLRGTPGGSKSCSQTIGICTFWGNVPLEGHR